MYFQLRHKAEDIAQMKIRSPWREDACENHFLVNDDLLSPKSTDCNTHQINVQKHLNNMKTKLSCQVGLLSWNTSLIFWFPYLNL